jgi:hypothetical protein
MNRTAEISRAYSMYTLTCDDSETGLRICRAMAYACAMTVLLLASCRGHDESHSAPSTTAAISSAPSVVDSVAAPAPTPVSLAAVIATEFRGSIGKSPIVVRLRNDGAKLHGKYFYENVGVDIALEGAIDGTHLVLDETSRGKRTGAFEGELASDGSLGGTWRGAATNHALAFQLASIPIAEDPQAALVFKKVATRTTHSRERDWTCDSRIEHPELFGLPAITEAKVNWRSSEFPESEEDRDAVRDGACVQTVSNYRVAYNANGIFSMHVTGYEFWSHAAHPNNEGHVVDFFLRDGAPIHLFGDVLAPATNARVEAPISKNMPSHRRMRALITQRQGTSACVP